MLSAHVSVYLMAMYYLNVHSFLQISCCFKVLVRVQHNQVKKLYFKQCHLPWAGVEAMGMSTGHCPAALPPVTPSWKGLCPWYNFLVLGIGFVLYFILRSIHDAYKPHSAPDYILSTEDFQVHLGPAYLLIALETTLFLQPDESELRLLS